MKKRILTTCWLTIGLMFSGCQNQDDNKDVSPAEVADVSTPAGFESSRKIAEPDQPAFEDYQEKRYGKTCDVLRNADGKIESYQPHPKFDLGIKPGETVYIFTTQNLQEGSIQMQRRLTVREISEIRALNEVSLVSISYLHLGEILTKPLMQMQTCGMVAGSGAFDCSDEKQDVEGMKENLTEAGYSHLKKYPDLDLTECSIENPVTQTSFVEEGTFQMEDGSKVPVYQETFEKTGSITCQGRSVGEGVAVQKVISSLSQKAFPSDFIQGSSCGGAVIFQSTVTKVGGKDGKTVSSTRYELKPLVDDSSKAPTKSLAQK